MSSPQMIIKDGSPIDLAWRKAWATVSINDKLALVKAAKILWKETVTVEEDESFEVASKYCGKCRRYLHAGPTYLSIICGHQMHESCLRKHISQNEINCPVATCDQEFFFDGRHVVESQFDPSMPEWRQYLDLVAAESNQQPVTLAPVKTQHNHIHTTSEMMPAMSVMNHSFSQPDPHPARQSTRTHAATSTPAISRYSIEDDCSVRSTEMDVEDAKRVRFGRLDLIQDTSLDDATDEIITPLPKSPSDPTYMPDETDGNETSRSDFTVDGDDLSFMDASMGGDYTETAIGPPAEFELEPGLELYLEPADFDLDFDLESNVQDAIKKVPGSLVHDDEKDWEMIDMPEIEKPHKTTTLHQTEIPQQHAKMSSPEAHIESGSPTDIAWRKAWATVPCDKKVALIQAAKLFRWIYISGEDDESKFDSPSKYCAKCHRYFVAKERIVNSIACGHNMHDSCLLKLIAENEINCAQCFEEFFPSGRHVVEKHFDLATPGWKEYLDLALNESKGEYKEEPVKSTKAQHGPEEVSEEEISTAFEDWELVDMPDTQNRPPRKFSRWFSSSK